MDLNTTKRQQANQVIKRMEKNMEMIPGIIQIKKETTELGYTTIDQGVEQDIKVVNQLIREYNEHFELLTAIQDRDIREGETEERSECFMKHIALFDLLLREYTENNRYILQRHSLAYIAA